MTIITAMRNYEAFWRGNRLSVVASTTYDAQKKAAIHWRCKHAFEITIVIADTPLSTNALPGA